MSDEHLVLSLLSPGSPRTQGGVTAGGHRTEEGEVVAMSHSAVCGTSAKGLLASHRH